jgi:hypothetical protein
MAPARVVPGPSVSGEHRRAVAPGARLAKLVATPAHSRPELTTVTLKEALVANVKESLARIMELDGALAAAVVDSNSGMMLGSSGTSGNIDLEVAAAGNTEVVRAKRKTMKALSLRDNIDDILITLQTQYHLIRPLTTNDSLFVYLVLDKTKSNLAMARHQLSNAEKALSV